MADQVNMTSIVMKSMEENGVNATFNRDLAVAYVSPDMVDRETQMRKDLVPEIELANASLAGNKITSEQRDLVVKSAMRSLDRQSDFNDRLLGKRR